MSQVTQTGRPGRYQRSASGLVGSMIVLVLVVLGIVLFRGAFRQTPSYQPEHVDYREVVASVQQAGLKPVYPARLPQGWYVKNATFTPGDRPVLDLAMVADGDKFADVHEEDAGIDELVHTYVDTAATEGDPVEVPGSVVTRWRSFSDPGGDHAYAAELGHQSVLVYGSADPAHLRDLVASLTRAHLQP